MLQSANALEQRVSQFRVQIRREEVIKTLRKSRQMHSRQIHQQQILSCFNNNETDFKRLAELLDGFSGQANITQKQLKRLFDAMRKETGEGKAEEDDQTKIQVIQKILLVTKCVIDEIGQELVEFSKGLLNSKELKRKELGFKIATSIASKGIAIRDRLMICGIATITEKIVNEYPEEFMKLQGALFASLMTFPVQRTNEAIIDKLITKQIKCLQSQHANILPIMQGICSCMRWKQNWVFDIIRKQGLLGQLLNLLTECSLPLQVIESVHYCIVLIAHLSPLQQQELAPHLPQFTTICLSLLSFPTTPKLKKDILFTLSNLFCCHRSEFIISFLSKNILEVFASLLRTEQRSVIAELAYALDCLMDSCRIECLEEGIIRSGLLEALKDKAEVYRLYPETTVGLFVGIIIKMLDSQLLRAKIQGSKMIREMLDSEDRQVVKAYWQNIEENTALDAW